MTAFDKIRAAAEAATPIAPAEPLADQAGDQDSTPPEDPPVDPRLADCALHPLNDYGNGLRLIAYFGEDMRFVPRLGWYRWAGNRWRGDEDELEVRRDAQQVAARILEEVEHLALEQEERDALDMARETGTELKRLEKTKPADLTDEDRERREVLQRIHDRAATIRSEFAKRKSAHRSHAKNSGNTSKISNMLQEAKPKQAIAVDALNTEKLALNVANGTLRFIKIRDGLAESFGQDKWIWTVQHDPHDRADLISKLVPVDYNPRAPRPKWTRFLETVQPDPEMRAFLKRWFGYSITGLTGEQKLAFLFGGGRNGKSTMVDTIAKVMADYATTLPIETLTGNDQRKASEATPDLVRLPGARMVRSSEPEQGQKLKEALVKLMTGGEAMMVRRLMQEAIEVTPEFKLTIQGNHRPEIRGGDDGIWRRIMLVPFETQIAEADVDPTLARDLWEQEAAGILAWLVEGCLDYLQTGLRPPEAVKAATDDYRMESDPVRNFLLTECEITGAPSDFTAARDLVDAFNAWRLANEAGAWGRRTVSNQIKARSGTIKSEAGDVYLPAKVSDTGYRGIRVKPEAMDRIADFRDRMTAAEDRRG